MTAPDTPELRRIAGAASLLAALLALRIPYFDGLAEAAGALAVIAWLPELAGTRPALRMRGLGRAGALEAVGLAAAWIVFLAGPGPARSAAAFALGGIPLAAPRAGRREAPG